jgi:hypothetical protein
MLRAYEAQQGVFCISPQKPSFHIGPAGGSIKYGARFWGFLPIPAKRVNP